MINLAAVGYLGIEGGNPTLIMRSWLMQALSKTPAAVVAVTDAALAVPGAERLHLVDDPLLLPEGGTSLLLSTEHTNAPGPREAAPDPRVLAGRRRSQRRALQRGGSRHLPSQSLLADLAANGSCRSAVAAPEERLDPHRGRAPEGPGESPAGAQGLLVEESHSAERQTTTLNSDDDTSPPQTAPGAGGGAVCRSAPQPP